MKLLKSTLVFGAMAALCQAQGDIRSFVTSMRTARFPGPSDLLPPPPYEPWPSKQGQADPKRSIVAHVLATPTPRCGPPNIDPFLLDFFLAWCEQMPSDRLCPEIVGYANCAVRREQDLNEIPNESTHVENKREETEFDGWTTSARRTSMFDKSFTEGCLSWPIDPASCLHATAFNEFIVKRYRSRPGDPACARLLATMEH